MLAIYTSIAKGDEDQQDVITAQYVSPTTAQIFAQVSRTKYILKQNRKINPVEFSRSLLSLA